MAHNQGLLAQNSFSFKYLLKLCWTTLTELLENAIPEVKYLFIAEGSILLKEKGKGGPDTGRQYHRGK